MNENQVLKKAYILFQDRLTFGDFRTKINNLGNAKWNFIRACILYQQALKCKKCEPNVAMVLLCSCADVIKIAGSSWKNFREFYLRYCPVDKQNPPITYHPNKKQPSQQAPFDKALNYIYRKFRSLYVHEGKGRLEINRRETREILLGNVLIDKHKGELYEIDMRKILEWFADITLESLYQFLDRISPDRTIKL